MTNPVQAKNAIGGQRCPKSGPARWPGRRTYVLGHALISPDMGSEALFFRLAEGQKN